MGIGRVTAGATARIKRSCRIATTLIHDAIHAARVKWNVLRDVV
jgi:hypothetical protein